MRSVSGLPPPPASQPPAPGRAQLRSDRRSGRRRDWLIGLAVLALIVAAVLVIRSRGGETAARTLTCARVDPAFLPALDLPAGTPAQYAKVKDFVRAGGGGRESIWLVAATVGDRTGVWAVDKDPGGPAPRQVVVLAPAASTDAAAISPKLAARVHPGAYQPGIPGSEALQASKDLASVSQVEDCV